MNAQDCANLWREVLYLTIEEALHGSKEDTRSREDRIWHTKNARDYLTRPNRDFNLICTYAGLDPEAARDRLKKLIAAAPTPEELIAAPTVKKVRLNKARTRPGVGSDFGRSKGTGGGTTAQERSKITFPTKESLQ